MPLGRKRTIKLKHADLLGREFIRVGSKAKYTYPNFTDFEIHFNTNWILDNLNWLDRNNAPGVASAQDYITMLTPVENPFTNSITFPNLFEFMFEDRSQTETTIFLPTQSHFIGTIDESGNIVP